MLERRASAGRSDREGAAMNQQAEARRKYWRRNLLYVEILLALWFLVSLGCGVLFVDHLDQFRIGGFPLGFWFAQQGAMYAFVAIIFSYVFLMNRLDQRFGVSDRDRKAARR
jgi:putative solute:sodium symporter small subunit